MVKNILHKEYGYDIIAKIRKEYSAREVVSAVVKIWGQYARIRVCAMDFMR